VERPLYFAPLEPPPDPSYRRPLFPALATGDFFFAAFFTGAARRVGAFFLATTFALGAGRRTLALAPFFWGLAAGLRDPPEGRALCAFAFFAAAGTAFFAAGFAFAVAAFTGFAAATGLAVFVAVLEAALLDAAVLDAAVLDAALLDAAVLDAALPDAALFDATPLATAA
jgi:hypothetical protein